MRLSINPHHCFYTLYIRTCPRTYVYKGMNFVECGVWSRLGYTCLKYILD